jgi:predicted CXXCH cytochrome family protein
MADFFAQSVHSEIFTLIGEPGCAACHRNHDIKQASDELLGLGENAVCGRCHVPGVGGGAAAVAMWKLIDSLRAGFDTADATLAQAELAGMEVSQAQFELDGAQSALISARAAVHSFDVDVVKEEVQAGLEITAKAQARGQRALKELDFRRLGLVISVTIILALIVGLLLKIRQRERTISSDPQPRQQHSQGGS